MSSLLGQPHHDGSPYYVGVPGASTLGDVVPVRIRVPHGVATDGVATDGVATGGGPLDRVVLRVVRDGEPEFSPAVRESADETGAWWRADVRMYNPVTSYRFHLSDRSGRYAWLNAAGTQHRDVTDAGDFRLVTHAAAPDWVSDQIAYQIFPDRFARSETARDVPSWAEPADWDDPVIHRGPQVPAQWYGGDLDGIAAHLDHVVSLGATLLYLTPVFEARSNHRYDAVSFDRVDQALGGDAALVRLLDAAHRRGLRVVGDLTTNHTGVEHDWFRRAVADSASEEAQYYYFRAHPHDYLAWLGIPTLPKLNHHSGPMRRRLYEGENSVVARWLQAGLDGWRIDVANMTGRAGADDHAQAVARATRSTALATRPDAWLLAEHAHDASLDLQGDGWHGAMDYAGFTRPVWAWLNGGSASGPGSAHGLQFLGLPVDIPVLPGSAVVETMRAVHAAIPWQSWMGSTSHLDSHDTPRFRTVTGGGTSGWIDSSGRGRARHLVGLALQMSLPGVPAIFMGDEIGLTAIDGEHARTPFPWHRRGEWDEETLHAYRDWMRLRAELVALRRGGLRWVHVGSDSMTFLREHPDQTVLVHASRAAHAPVRLPLAALGLRSARQLVCQRGEQVTSADPEVDLPAGGPAAHAYVLDVD